jgi:hypothetical protein
MRKALAVVGRVVAWIVVLVLWGAAWLNAFEHRGDFAWSLAYRGFLLVVSAGALASLVPRDGRLKRTTELLFLLVLPLWGYEENIWKGSDECNDQAHLLALPEAAGVLVAYVVTLAAYLAARLRPDGFRGPAEPLVRGLVAFGVLIAGVVAVHVLPMVPEGVMFFTEGGCSIGPAGVAWLYVALLWRRAARNVDGRRSLGSTLVVAAGAVVAYAAANALWLKSVAGALSVVTRTTGGVFSQIPRVECDDHYLCTVAARGSVRLVGPLRPGRRRGRPIMVNRQLAIANAFEDLLHERWPRAARRIRIAYDRLGLPLSRCIRRRWAADVTYLLMKPAEWSFLAVLRSFDPDPEARIERMYR